MRIRTNKPNFLDNLITALIVGALCTFTLGLVPHFYFGVAVGTVYVGFVLLCMVVGHWPRRVASHPTDYEPKDLARRDPSQNETVAGNLLDEHLTGRDH